MKKALALILFGLALALSSQSASAHEYDRGDSDHPLRYVAYALHPIGMFGEYAICRPIHYVVSQPTLCIIFGHEPREEPGHNYMELK